MTKQSENMLEMMFNSDPTITEEQKRRVLAVLRGDEAREDHLLSRQQVGIMLNKSPQMVDYYCNKGLLRKVTFGESSRASGILASSVSALLHAGKIYG